LTRRQKIFSPQKCLECSGEVTRREPNRNHGNSEFSVMMHMREGSVTVKAGQHVTQGQVIGRLGNSGDSFGPHLHYQLQSGPDLFRDPSIPFIFQNVNRINLFRGTYFHTK
jgi:murein DD-endopeptidase MepM/ murein hydrolase activator NlpD